MERKTIGDIIINIKITTNVEPTSSPYDELFRKHRELNDKNHFNKNYDLLEKQIGDYISKHNLKETNDFKAYDKEKERHTNNGYTDIALEYDAKIATKILMEDIKKNSPLGQDHLFDDTMESMLHSMVMSEVEKRESKDSSSVQIGRFSPYKMSDLKCAVQTVYNAYIKSKDQKIILW